MSRKIRSGSSISTRSAKKGTLKIQETSRQPDNAMTADEPAVVSRGSNSRLDAAVQLPERRREWDNDVRFHVSRHLLHLRRFRKMSQARLAERIGASQSHIARIESGAENVGASTIERMVNALDGRFDVSIAPAEMAGAGRRPWWEASDPAIAGDWTLRRIETRKMAGSQELRVTVGRNIAAQDTLSKSSFFIEEAKAS